MPTRELEEDMMGWFSAVIERHPRRTLVGAIAVAVAIAMATALLVGIQIAQANHPEASLPGSNFEIDTDANLKVDDAAPSIDWAGVSETRKADQPTGQQDDSFGQGTKEDTAVPTIVNGSIPNNKSDLLNFGVYLETTTAGGNFLTMFWHRVQEPTGTTNMDFEFNQNECSTEEPDGCSSNGVTPIRKAGDVLIQYDLAQGGTTPELFVSKWVETGNKSLCEAANSTPCWGDRINLTAAGDAAGSINTTAIPSADSDGLGNVSPRTFGEAHVDLNALTGGGCAGFASAYLKSRASDSFTAATKDFIAPLSTNFDACKTLSTAQKLTPQDSATITGDGDLAGSVTFKLFETLSDCQDNTDPLPTPLYSETKPVTGTDSATVSTNNTTYHIDDGKEGDYYWRVDYFEGSDTTPAITSCEENFNVTTINNGNPVTEQ